ncbi:MAG: response regulator transcription factor [Vulcanimicrobiaceae bacterium]
MRDAYDRAHFSTAAEIFDRNGMVAAPIETVLLRARIFLKSNPKAAVQLLAAKDQRKRDRRQRAEQDMLLGVAHARTQQFSRADRYFKEADESACAVGDRDLIAEIGYHRAVRYAMERRLPDAYAELTQARVGRTDQSRFNASQAESFILAQEQRYLEQAHVLMELLRQIDPHGEKHAETRAWATHTLAVLAREMHLPDAAPLIERHLDGRAWPEDFAINRFQALKAFGWVQALRGDYFNAFRHLKASFLTIEDNAWRTMALLDRAYLARCINEPRWSRQELAEAEEHAARVNWQATHGEERMALLLLAELFSSIDAGKAADYLRQYSDLGDIDSPLMHFKYDERPRALADYSRGVVEIALGNRKQGVSLLKHAQKVFERIRYDWRAGRCSLRLFEMTRDRAALEDAAERLRNYTASWLGDELRALSSPASAQVQLPRMQRRVFEALCRGLSNAQIAQEIGRSEFTVRNHVKVIFKTFGVRSRSSLIAEAMKRDLI